jgi:hypothetical protein
MKKLIKFILTITLFQTTSWAGQLDASKSMTHYVPLMAGSICAAGVVGGIVYENRSTIKKIWNTLDKQYPKVSTICALGILYLLRNIPAIVKHDHLEMGNNVCLAGLGCASSVLSLMWNYKRLLAEIAGASAIFAAGRHSK